jgi:hypothetical protein
VQEGEYGGNIMYCCMKTEKWDLLKLFQDGAEGDKAEWGRGWIQP